MKQKFNYYSTVLAFLLFIGSCSIAIGQDQNREKMREKAKAHHTAFITEQLELTAAEAEKFWPIYNSYQSELKAIKKSTFKKPGEDMNDAQAEQMLESMMAYKQKEVETQTKYIKEFKTALPTKKIIKLFYAEKKFSEQLVSQIKSRSERERKE